MFGLDNFWISLVYILSILSAIGCVIYGILYWNKGDNDSVIMQEEKQWAEKEKKVEENL